MAGVVLMVEVKCGLLHVPMRPCAASAKPRGCRHEPGPRYTARRGGNLHAVVARDDTELPQIEFPK